MTIVSTRLCSSESLYHQKSGDIGSSETLLLHAHQKSGDIGSSETLLLHAHLRL